MNLILKFIPILLSLTFTPIFAESTFQSPYTKLIEKNFTRSQKISVKQSNARHVQIPKILNEWENVQAHIKDGHPMLIIDNNEFLVAADWIEKFKFALYDLGQYPDYQDWLAQFFNEEYPMKAATAEIISKMTFDDITYWITYLSRFDRWNDYPGYHTVIIDEIKNGRMEALIENLKSERG